MKCCLKGICTGTGSYASKKENRVVEQVFVGAGKQVIGVECSNALSFALGDVVVVSGDLGVYERTLYLRDASCRLYNEAEDAAFFNDVSDEF